MSERQPRLDGEPEEPPAASPAAREQTARLVYDIGCGRIVAHGVLDFGFTEQLTGVLAATLAEHPAHVVLDLGDVWLVDAAVVRVLIAFSARATAVGSELRIVNAGGVVRRVLEITGVLAVLAGSACNPSR
jgi:anti-anti-sigma factor